MGHKKGTPWAPVAQTGVSQRQQKEKAFAFGGITALSFRTNPS
jgi:hypothetical protein